MRKPKPKTPPQTSRRGLGIVNRYGEFWSRDVFDTAKEAKIYFDRFWQSPGFEHADKPKWSDYRLVKVRQTIKYTSEFTDA